MGLPMEIVGPVVGIGGIIMSVAAGIVMVKYASYRMRLREGHTSALPPDIEDRLAELEQLKFRVGELEERQDFTERLLAKPRDPP